ncbi:hypothetical protein [Streptomyces sp. JW3]|uniref:hypothetical protein n=1 Tax=Streptomyces sp. JW3 TaxID=3456955 RepID=UPI003FA4C1BB
MNNRTLLGAVLLCVTAMVTLTACGEDKKAAPSPAEPFEGLSAAQISEKSRLAMVGLKSFRVKGDMTSEGKEMTVDVVVAGKGNCLGTFGVEGGTVRVRWLGGATYLKGDKAFWQQSAGEGSMSSEQADALVEVIEGRWLKESSAEEEFPFCDTTTMFTKDKTDSSLTRGDDTEVDGTQAVTLKGKDGAETRSLVIAAQGEPYALKMITKGGDEPQTVEFSAFNKPVTLPSLSADEVMDLNELQK